MFTSIPPEVKPIANFLLAVASVVLQIAALVALNLLTFFHNVALTAIPWLVAFTSNQAENTNTLIETMTGITPGSVQPPYLFLVSNGQPVALPHQGQQPQSSNYVTQLPMMQLPMREVSLVKEQTTLAKELPAGDTKYSYSYDGLSRSKPKYPEL